MPVLCFQNRFLPLRILKHAFISHTGFSSTFGLSLHTSSERPSEPHLTPTLHYFTCFISIAKPALFYSRKEFSIHECQLTRQSQYLQHAEHLVSHTFPYNDNKRCDSKTGKKCGISEKYFLIKRDSILEDCSKGTKILYYVPHF